MDGAINAVRAALAQGLDWKELDRLIETETRAGNPVASMVESLHLDTGRVTLLLSNDLDEEECDEDALARPATRVSSGVLCIAFGVQSPLSPDQSCHVRKVITFSSP